MKLLSLLFIFGSIAEASNVPTDVGQAISEALKGKWVFQSFEVNKRIWGFDSSTKLSDIKAGDPFQLFSISQMDFEEAKDDIPVDSLLKPGDWYAPLYVDGKLMQMVMLIGTHFGEREKWSAGIRSFGQLAKTWMQIKEVWPETKGYHPKLVLISEPMEHNLCLYIPEKGPHNLTIIGNLYMKFTPITDGLSYKELAASEETFRGIKDRISKSNKKSDSLWAEKKRINDSLAIIRELATEHLWKKYEIKEPVVSNSAVMSWWNNMLVEADEAIIPGHMSKEELKAQTLKQAAPIGKRLVFAEGEEGITIDSQIMKSAHPLRVGAKPIDKTISKEQDDWYVLFAQDGSGFIRIGSTGSLLLVDAPYKEGQKWGLGGSRSSYDVPENGADLVEISSMSPSELATRWRVEKAFLKIHTENTKPIHYRISFVAEMPEHRTGCAYGPGVAARNYLMAAASGNSVELYRTTRSRFTATQALMLRKKLFGTADIVNISSTHRKPGALEVNAEGELHVQHIILSTGNSDGNCRAWAFEIICVKRDGLWLVADAYRDPELSEKQVEDLVKRDFLRMTR